MRQLTKYSQHIVWENLCIRYLWRLEVEQKHQHQQQQQQPWQRQKMTTTLVNHTLLRTPFFLSFTLAFSFLRCAWCYWVRFTYLRMLNRSQCISSSCVLFAYRFRISIPCCAVVTLPLSIVILKIQQIGMKCVCVCAGLVGVHFSLFRCISVSLLAFKRAICHLFTSSTPINFIYFFASFFFVIPFTRIFFRFFFSFVFVRLIQHSFSRSTLFDCWLFDFFAWKMDWKHLSTQSSVLIAKRIRWLQNLCVYLGDSDIAMESYGALERLNDRVWRKLIE